MAAPMSLRKVLGRFKLLCRKGTECRRYANASAAAKEKVSEDPIPWEEKQSGIVLLRDHPPFMFKFEDALKMHKEAAQPAMSNNPEARIYADMLLDFTTKKVSKPMKHSVDILKFPHSFDIGEGNKYMVFSESEETVELARSLGAIASGGLPLIELMLLGRVHKEDIDMTDFVLATPEIFPKMAKLRSILKLKFPNHKNDTVGEDIKAMMDKLNDGLRYTTDKNPIDNAHARVQIPFGQLHQEDEKLTENFDYMIQHLLHKKSETLTPYVKETILIAPPSEERFMLNMNYIKRKSLEEIQQTTEANSEPDQTETSEPTQNDNLEKSEKQ